MANPSSLVARAKGSLQESLGEGLQKHSLLFTGFAVVLILITGVGLADGKEQWWLSSLAITFCFLLFFLFLNARVFIKATLALLVTLFTANFALQAGVLINPYSSVGLVWMGAQFFLFFLLIALSYLVTGYRSRWSGAMIALPLSLLAGVTYLSFVAPIWALLLMVLTGVAVFLGYYKLLGRMAVKEAAMPQNRESEAIREAIYGAGEAEGWAVRELSTTSLRKRVTTDYLVWNEEHAFLLHPVKLQSKFGISASKKAARLVHQGYSINSWLLSLVNRRIPLWRSRNASIMLVLLDSENTNGKRPEAIGVAVPDSKRRIPVGVYPARGFLTGKSSGVLADLDKHYGEYLGALTEKQKAAMSEMGREGNSEYLEPTADSSVSA